ncbi:hypothetical protein CSUI_008622 [Cystoisospora suis]|uniref:Uncharacterized protein n=1 Tax=Cystoisospora suis TaxID=483139 RepID=A0A2C6KLQ8_9APIC|nr:hypothetical protein CSUI_008622 [Cystoisospora suis]
MIRPEGEIMVTGGQEEMPRGLEKPRPGFESPLALPVFDDVDEAPNGPAPVSVGPRLFAINCETGDAEEILTRKEVERYLLECQQDTNSMAAPPRELHHPYEGCRSHCIFTTASSAAPKIPLTPLPIDQLPGGIEVDCVPRHFLEYPATEQEKWKTFQKTYLQYLQWETEKARYNLPYLLAPDLLSSYLSGTDRNTSRPGSQGAAKGSHSRSSKHATVSAARAVRLPSFPMSVQALELNSLFLRRQAVSLGCVEARTIFKQSETRWWRGLSTEYWGKEIYLSYTSSVLFPVRSGRRRDAAPIFLKY